MPIAAAREPARFTPLAFRSLNTIQPLHTAFTTNLEQATDGDPSREFGLICFLQFCMEDCWTEIGSHRYCEA